MDVKRTIAELTAQLSEVNYDSEEDNVLLKDSNTDDVPKASEEEIDYGDVEPSKLRKNTHTIKLPECVYGGTTTTRKRIFPLTDFSDDESINNVSENGSLDYNDGGVDTEHESDIDESYTSEREENNVVSSKTIRSNKNDGTMDLHIYSAGSNSIPSDVKKGSAIRNQLRIWESLLECRIKLQKALAACNRLPVKENLIKAKTQLESQDQTTMNKCKKQLIHLLDKMVDLQEDLLKQCQDYKYDKELSDSEVNEEVPSDESEIEGVEEEQDQPLKKRKTLNEYSNLLKANHDNFIPFRNTSIQKWNDKTKVSTGKMANSNFSAFDQSTLKQIEQIMADKSRLVNRTRIKRNNSHSNSIKYQEQSNNTQEIPQDPEIFDDSDFYHKLLRDYIEKKSVDIINSTHTERQLIELQKLRSRMKKNIDTKSTKGRKLRYVIIPKLVNFMAPNPYNTWSEEAETELYNSLFGKIKVS